MNYISSYFLTENLLAFNNIINNFIAIYVKRSNFARTTDITSQRVSGNTTEMCHGIDLVNIHSINITFMK